MRKFRNYSEQEVCFDAKTNVLVGPNGHGKTNVLEAIFFISMLRSFRTASPRDIRKIGADAFFLSATLSDIRGYDKLLEVHYADTRRLRIDASPVFKASEFIGAYKAVAFLPSDLMIVTEGAGVRRRFINMLLCSFDKPYLSALNDYSNALKLRNSLLKSSNPDQSSLSAFENILADNGVAIIARRKNATQTLSTEMSQLFRKIKGADATFRIEYPLHPQSENIETYSAKLAADRRRDSVRGNTSFGPHLDDFQFLLKDKPLRAFGSTGECRLAALCLKLASVKLIENDTGGTENTIALIDDVTGELDNKTRDAFFEIVSGANQTFFTFTEPPSDVYFENAHILNVRNGLI
jgi:DNA replication and repair protein RecF